MCKDCGCGHTHGEKDERKVIKVDASISSANDVIASTLRKGFTSQGIFCVNIMGSPGSGKTTVIEELAARLGPSSLAVIQGDLESDIDKRRLERIAVRTVQINTHSGCHLTAHMIEGALSRLDLTGKKYLFIENVGNLVCPAGVFLGQHTNLVVSSTTEGSDKPRKYPHIFRDASIIVIAKADLADAVGFDETSYLADLRMIAGKAHIIKTAKGKDEGFEDLARALAHKRDHALGLDHHH